MKRSRQITHISAKQHIQELPRMAVLSKCSSAVYLYSQSTTHSLMARYLSRLNSYPFRILVHKAGSHMNIADRISRFWTIEETLDTKGRISLLQGILVKTVFPVGTIVTPNDSHSNSGSP